MKGVLDVNELPLVSIDFNHNSHSCVADLTQTQVQMNGLCGLWAGMTMNGALPTVC